MRRPNNRSSNASSLAVPELTQTVDHRGSGWRIGPDTLVPLAIAAVYVAAEIVLYSFHEAWLDEAQAWLVAKQLTNPLDFLIIPGEGHPPVWYWLLRLLSMILSFDQARPLFLAVATINALLLVRLVGDRPVLLALFLFSLPIIHSWGFHFRPYGLILTCVVSALLLDRKGMGVAATWVIAWACGLNFLSGWLLAFWLLVQVHRSAPVAKLVAPALLGAAFGISAALSSLGNADAGVQNAPVLEGLFDILALPFALPSVHPAIIVVAVCCILAYGLRRSPFILVGLTALLLLLGLFGALIYGLREWHTAFGLMLMLMAFEVTRASVWPLVLLLLPQAYWGVRAGVLEVEFPDSAAVVAYRAVMEDAGDQLDTEHNLVAWPDHVLTPAAASYGFRFISGNNGAVVTYIDWRRGKDGDISYNVLAQTPTPYWFVCFQCEDPLAVIQAAGRRATQIMPTTEAMTWTLAAYRIDGPAISP